MDVVKEIVKVDDAFNACSLFVSFILMEIFVLNDGVFMVIIIYSFIISHDNELYTLVISTHS